MMMAKKMNFALSITIPSLTFGILLLAGLAACKTAEEIKRDKMVDSMSLQMVETQKNTVDISAKLAGMERKIALLTGQFEEKGHETNRLLVNELDNLGQQVNMLREKQHTQQMANTQINQDLKTLNAELESQRQILSKILDSIGKISGVAPKSNSSAANNPYEEAMEDYAKNNHQRAVISLGELYKSKKYKGNQLARILHNLGMSCFQTQKYPDAIIYFSKLYTDHPNFKFNNNGLFHLALSFHKQGEKEKAIATLEQMIQAFPDYHRNSQAQELIASWKK